MPALVTETAPAAPPPVPFPPTALADRLAVRHRDARGERKAAVAAAAADRLRQDAGRIGAGGLDDRAVMVGHGHVAGGVSRAAAAAADRIVDVAAARQTRAASEAAVAAAAADRLREDTRAAEAVRGDRVGNCRRSPLRPCRRRRRRRRPTVEVASPPRLTPAPTEKPPLPPPPPTDWAMMPSAIAPFVVIAPP